MGETKESLRTLRAISPSNTLSQCKKQCNGKCKKRKFDSLDVDLPEPMKKEALCEVKSRTWKRRKGIPEDVPVGLDEDYEDDFLSSPFDLDLWLWENGLNLEVFERFEKSLKGLDPNLSIMEKVKELKDDKKPYRNLYSLFCWEETLETSKWDWCFLNPRKKSESSSL